MAKRKKRVVKSFGRKAWSYRVETVTSEPQSDPEKNVLALLDEIFPHGHEAFNAITLSEMKLHSDKSVDYASGGHPLGNFIRVAKMLSLYPRLDLSDPKVVAMIYCMKQIDAVLWGLSQGHEQKCEGLDGRFADMSIYSKIERCMMREKIGRQSLDLPKP